jgi:hypothetical protein
MMIPGVDPGPKWIDDTVHFFFQPAGAKSGIDLMSINIQRGRDHGINSFTEVRKACMQQGRFRSLYRGAKMKTGWGNIVKIYGDVQEVDLYVGMLMEEPVPGSKLGPTSICATVDQFVALKNGDKHWYENADMFSKTQLAAIKKMSLSHVFCQTLTDEDFTVTHNFPMVALGRQFKGKMNRRAACSQMENFDFSAWQDFKLHSKTLISVLGKDFHQNQLRHHLFLAQPVPILDHHQQPLSILSHHQDRLNHSLDPLAPRLNVQICLMNGMLIPPLLESSAKIFSPMLFTNVEHSVSIQTIL